MKNEASNAISPELEYHLQAAYLSGTPITQRTSAMYRKVALYAEKAGLSGEAAGLRKIADRLDREDS